MRALFNTGWGRWAGCVLLAAFAELGMTAIATAALPDFALFDELLLHNVRNGFVDYDGFQADPRFRDIVRQIGETDSVDQSTPNEQLAFLINAYNVLVIQGILDGLSPATARARHRFLRRHKFLVAGEAMSLEELAQERIKPLGEPRMHFAMVCGALSCPRLWNRAYRAESLNEQLDDAARRFANDPTRNYFDPSRRVAMLSMIFHWYSGEFAMQGGSVQRYLAKFVNDPAVAELLRNDSFDLRYRDYDWSLNGYLRAGTR